MVRLFTKTKMKRKSKKSVLIVIFMSALLQGVYASVTDAEVSRALMALKGMEYGMTEQQAVETVRDAALNRGNARAMNALGLFCMNGMFVDKDTVMGVSMLEAAGAGGYAEAYHNLGVTYKLARHGIGQDSPGPSAITPPVPTAVPSAVCTMRATCYTKVWAAGRIMERPRNSSAVR